jgi:hypothetical protein
MFRSLMMIIKELYLYLTKVIFMLKHSVKLHHFINYVMWQNVVERLVLCAVQIGSHSAQHTTHMPLYDILTHHQIYITT